MTPSFYKGDYEDVKATSLNSHAVRQGPGNGERAYHDWIRRAQTGEEPYAAFFDATRRARDGWRARLVRRLTEAADWRAAAFLLERQFPAEFGSKVAEGSPTRGPRYSGDNST